MPAPSSKDPERIESRLVDDEDKDGGKLPRKKRAPPMKERAAGDQDSGTGLEVPEARHREKLVRDLRINERILERYGYTEACTRCNHKQLNLPHRAHSHACRMRIYLEMEKDEQEATVLEEARRRLEKRARTEKEKTVESEAKDGIEDRDATTPETPGFGGEDKDEQVEAPMDEIPDLEDSDEDINGDGDHREDDPLRDHKRKLDGEDDEDDGTDEEQPGKRQRLKSIVPYKPAPIK